MSKKVLTFLFIAILAVGIFAEYSNFLGENGKIKYDTNTNWGNANIQFYDDFFGVRYMLQSDLVDSTKFKFGLGFEGLMLNPYIILTYSKEDDNTRTTDQSTFFVNKTHYIGFSDDSTTVNPDNYFGFLFGGEYALDKITLPFELELNNYTYPGAVGNYSKLGKNLLSGPLGTGYIDDIDHSITTDPATDSSKEKSSSDFEDIDVDAHKSVMGIRVKPMYKFNDVYTFGLGLEYMSVSRKEDVDYRKYEWDTKKSTDVSNVSVEYEKKNSDIILNPVVKKELGKTLYELGLKYEMSSYEISSSITNKATKVNNENPVFPGDVEKVDKSYLYVQFKWNSEILENVKAGVEFETRVNGKETTHTEDYSYGEFTNTSISNDNLTLSNITENATNTKVSKKVVDDSVDYLGVALKTLKTTVSWDINDSWNLYGEVNMAFLSKFLKGDYLPWLITGDAWSNVTPLSRVVVTYKFK